MSKFLVAGLINIETTLKIDGFPIHYAPVRYPFHGVNSSVSGVGYNIAKALNTLGHRVDFLSLIGRDPAAELVRSELHALQIDDSSVLPALDQTPQSVILYDSTGSRAINVDLKDIQDRTYPAELAKTALAACDMAVICNINFSRQMLTMAKQMGVTIASDVHAIADPDSDYDADYMRHADILFMSHENLPCSPEQWVRTLWARYSNRIIVIGLGGEGALLALRDEQQIQHYPAQVTRPIINTIGAGDALFSAFLHSYQQMQDARIALQKAMLFASYKIGASGAADGFLDAAALDRLHAQNHS
jgi:ribokinase